MHSFFDFLLCLFAYGAIGFEINFYLLRRQGLTFWTLGDAPDLKKLKEETEMAVGAPCEWFMPATIFVGIACWPWLVIRYIHAFFTTFFAR